MRGSPSHSDCPAHRTRSKGPAIQQGSLRDIKRNLGRGKKRAMDFTDEGQRKKLRVSDPLGFLVETHPDASIQVIDSQDSDVYTIHRTLETSSPKSESSTECEDNEVTVPSDPSGPPSPNFTPLQPTFSRLGVDGTTSAFPLVYQISLPPFPKPLSKENLSSSLTSTEPPNDMDQNYDVPMLHLETQSQSQPESDPSICHSTASSPTPTEPATPEIPKLTISKGKKPIPYIIQLPNGGCQYRFPSDADFNYRSPSPSPPPTPKVIGGRIPLRKEKRVLFRRPNLAKTFLNEEVYAASNMVGIKVVDFAWSVGHQKRHDPLGRIM